MERNQRATHIEPLRVLHGHRHLTRHCHQSGAPQSSAVSRNIATVTVEERHRIALADTEPRRENDQIH